MSSSTTEADDWKEMERASLREMMRSEALLLAGAYRRTLEDEYDDADRKLADPNWVREEP